jgi:homoserine kinase
VSWPQSCSVFAPASSANLGPGFDSLAVALDRWLRVDLAFADHAEQRAIDAPDLLGGGNLVIEAMHATATRLGLRLPGCDLRVFSDIPVARGLGSSAAAIVAGVRAAGVLAGVDISDAVVVDIGGTLEGHADNVSAAVLGGVTVAMHTERGYIAEVLEAELPWVAVVFVPDSPSLTKEARGVLPSSIPMADAAANVGRGVLLAHALRLRRADLLREAMRDRMHQPYRARIFPHLESAILAALDAGAAGASLSGAGPTIFAFAEPERAGGVADAMASAAEGAGVPGAAHVLEVVTRGCHVQ